MKEAVYYAAEPGGEIAFTVPPQSLKFGAGSLAEIGADARGFGLERVALFLDRHVADHIFATEAYLALHEISDDKIPMRRRAADAIELGACEIANIKPGRVGGYLEAVRIHDHCRSKEVPVWCGGMLETEPARALRSVAAA